MNPEKRPWLQLWLCYLTIKKIFSPPSNLVQTLEGASRHRFEQNVESAPEDCHERGNHKFAVVSLSIDNAFCSYFFLLYYEVMVSSIFFIWFIFFWLLVCFPSRQILNLSLKCLMAIIISKQWKIHYILSVLCMFSQKHQFSVILLDWRELHWLIRNENPLSTEHEHSEYTRFPYSVRLHFDSHVQIYPKY